MAAPLAKMKEYERVARRVVAMVGATDGRSDASLAAPMADATAAQMVPRKGFPMVDGRAGGTGCGSADRRAASKAAWTDSSSVGGWVGR